jgi:hypothetical protein
MSTSRRYFLKQASAITLGFTGLQHFVGAGMPDMHAAPTESRWTDQFGALKPDPDGILDLPDGFSYRIISRHGDRMDDGFFVPHRADGMATFPGPDGRTILIRNHEVSIGADRQEGPFRNDESLAARLTPAQVYDHDADGIPCPAGTTTVVFNTEEQRVERQFLSLVGTERNCAGGPTPWNTWITCEETVRRAGDNCEHDHGYPFEVPASAQPQLAQPVPLKAMGRFNHEAVAVDPASGIVYQTEDRGDGLVYRYIPDQPGQLAAGGRLQALVVADQPSLDTRNWETRIVSPGEPMPVRWIDLDDIQAPNDDLRHRGFEDGAARFARGEGMWYGKGSIFFACTNGGSIKKGQIWKYTPSAQEGRSGESNEPGTLELFVEPNDGGLIDNADNLTVAPWGDLIVCEDGSGEQYLVGITPDGSFYKFAHNAMDNDSEMAGATFSPDGSTFFVNIQHAGLTLAITGPWDKA